MEFSAAVSRFVVSTLLPVIVPDLDARSQLALLTAGTSLGLFVALPLSTRMLRAWGTRRTVAIGVTGYVTGLVASALAGSALVFAVGQFVSGTAGGLLAVFGISAAISRLEDSIRANVVAVSAAMWILPALIGPAATLGLEHVIGWRWTLFVPVPIVLIGRLLIVRAVRDDEPETSPQRPLVRSLLIPLGAAGIIFGGQWWLVVGSGIVLSLIGAAAVMPTGTLRVRRGSQAALVGMMLFGMGYFGADSLITVLLTEAYGARLREAALVLSSAPVAWGITSLVVAQTRSDHVKRHFSVIGLGLSASAVISIATSASLQPFVVVATLAWATAGVGVGLAYPSLYVAASTPRSSTLSSGQLAVAVITAEVFGGLIGQSVGGAISSAHGTSGLVSSFFLFASCFALASAAATRIGPDANPCPPPQ